MENNELTTYEPDEQYMVAFSGFEDEPQKNMNAKLVAHAKKMSLIRHERPDTRIPYKVGIYIRFFNQTYIISAFIFKYFFHIIHVNC